MKREAVLARWLPRWLPSLGVLAGFGLFAALHFWDERLYVAVLGFFDESALPRPFADLGAIMQAERCWRAGVNVFLPTPCMGGGVYNYAPFLLWVMRMPVGAFLVPVYGVAVAGCMAGVLALLPPAASPGEMWARLVVSASPASLYALERANFDVIVLMMLITGGLLLCRAVGARAFGYGLILLAGLCKFYPVFALVSLLRERWPVLLALTVLAVLAVLCAGLGFLPFMAAVHNAMISLPHGWPFDGQFGAINIAYGVRILRAPGAFFSGTHMFAYQFGAFDDLFFGTMLVLGAVLVALGVKRYRGVVLSARDPAGAVFMLAAAVMVGCFFAAQNGNYREIFLIPLVPALCRMDGRAAGLSWRLERVLAGIVFTVWQPAIHALIFDSLGWLTGNWNLGVSKTVFWAFRELVFWWVMIEIAAILLAMMLVEVERLARAAAYRGAGSVKGEC